MTPECLAPDCTRVVREYAYCWRHAYYMLEPGAPRKIVAPPVPSPLASPTPAAASSTGPVADGLPRRVTLTHPDVAGPVTLPEGSSDLVERRRGSGPRCSVEGCENKAKRLSLCSKHYNLHRDNGDLHLFYPECQAEGCHNKVASTRLKYCPEHKAMALTKYQRKICSVEGCSNKSRAFGKCDKHNINKHNGQESRKQENN